MKIKDLGIVIVAAGNSSRFGKEDKLTLKLNGKPLFTHCLETFSQLVPSENIVVVTSNERIHELADIIHKVLNTKIKVIPGGAQRSDSSLNGLKELPETLLYAAVHDAARPFISSRSIELCYKTLKVRGSAVLAHPVTDTIKIAGVDSQVIKTPLRETLYAAETPQMFQRRELIDAYVNKPGNVNITDEAMAMEIAGHPVFLATHEEDNRKITYLKDLKNNS